MSGTARVMQKLKDANAKVELLDFRERWLIMSTGDVLPITGVYDADGDEVEEPCWEHIEDIIDIEFGSDEIGYAVMHNQPGNLYYREDQ